jgi:hypothetical protein
MLWMLYNMIYFDDPLMFAYGRGSARDYAQEYFFRTGKSFATAGKLWDSLATYFVDVAYCVNPIVLWFGIAGLVISLAVLRRRYWRPTVVLAVGAMAPFMFYAYNLYSNSVPLLMPGLVKDEPDSIFNVRYGTVMAATTPLFAAVFLFFVIRQVERQRMFSLLLLTPLFLPDPIPASSAEPVVEQFTQNLFYTEAIHNQSFWMPPFVEVALKLKTDMDAQTGSILTNTRIEHVVVWATGIPMRRFVNEMNKGYWEPNLYTIQPGIRWVVTEEGDQLWHAQGKFLQANFVEVARAKLPSTGTVHLYKRPE